VARRAVGAGGVEEGSRASGVRVALAWGSGIGAAGVGSVEEAKPSRAGRWPAASGESKDRLGSSRWR
jgi:hypothetical protein